jgi:hypothetical protein
MTEFFPLDRAMDERSEVLEESTKKKATLLEPCSLYVENDSNRLVVKATLLRDPFGTPVDPCETRPRPEVAASGSKHESAEESGTVLPPRNLKLL